MLCRAKLSSVSQVGLDAATDSVLFFPTGGVSFCSGVDRARGSFGEPKVTPPFLVYTLSDVTSQSFDLELQRLHLVSPLLLDSSPGPVVLQQPRPEIILHLLFLYLFSTFSGCSPHLTADKDGRQSGGPYKRRRKDPLPTGPRSSYAVGCRVGTTAHGC